MAHRAPAAVQSENFHIRIGKDVDPVKPALPKPAKAGRQDRKALKDLSNTGKPPVSGPSKASAPKEKSAIRRRETIKNVPKCTLFADEEMKKCHEWAKDGIEHAYFTTNDLQKLQKDIAEERVKKQVQKVMSDLFEWSNAAYDLALPEKKKPSMDTTVVKKMEMEPELLPCITKSPSSGHEVIDDPLEFEYDRLLFLERPVELELKEDQNADAASCLK